MEQQVAADAPAASAVEAELVAKREELAKSRGEGLLRVLRIGIVVAALTMVIDASVYLGGGDPSYRVFSLLAGLAVVAVAYGTMALHAGRFNEAVAVPLVYILLVAPVGPALLASRALISVALPFIAMAVAMSFAARRHVVPYAIGSWLSGTAVLGSWQWRMVESIGTDVTYAVTNTVTASIILGFTFYALSQYSRRLQAAFDDVQGSAVELADAHERLRETDAARVRFMNNAAHELKTPITPISIQLHLLKRSPLAEDPRARRSVEILERNFKRLERLVGDIVDGARMDAGRLDFRKVPVALSDSLHEAVEEYERAAELSGIRLACHIDPDLHVQADPIRIRQVVDNFLSNALKFTRPSGTVTLDAFVRDGDICVSVRDDGLGIAPQDLKRLFQPFTQVHDPMKTVTGGSGLGLYIARGIVERHGGRIFVESEGLGKGTTFSFLLPRLSREAVAADAVEGGSGERPGTVAPAETDAERAVIDATRSVPAPGTGSDAPVRPGGPTTRRP